MTQPASTRRVNGGPQPPQYPIESVDNALRLLLLFAEQPRIRLTDASTYLGVASSTAHRLLAMLQYRGFVRQDGASRAYEPGTALATIAFATIRQLDVRARVHPILERLSAELGETVHLGRLEGAQVHFLDSIESTRAVRVGGRMGRSSPAHCTSTGKALLSQLSTEELHGLYPNEELGGLTDRSLTSRKALEKDLKASRRRGYAASAQESEEGVTSVAVPVAGQGGVRYAVNASVPVHRMSTSVRTTIVTALTDAAEELSQLLV